MDKMRMESKDLTAGNIKKIGALFPNCITETVDKDGKPKKAINFDILRQMLSPDVVEGDEAYEFTWVGKKAAMVEAHRPIRKTLRPCVEESVDWDKTENLYIEGDNLEVLKLLQESYLGAVKMIYIDKRIAYLIQANENENSLKALDIRGFREFLILDASPVNGRFRGNRPRFAYEILPTGANKKTAV